MRATRGPNVQVELTKSIRAIFAQETQLAGEMPTEEIPSGETIRVEGPGDYLYGQPTAAIVDAEDIPYFILLDQLLDAVPPGAREGIEEIARTPDAQ